MIDSVNVIDYVILTLPLTSLCHKIERSQSGMYSVSGIHQDCIVPQ